MVTPMRPEPLIVCVDCGGTCHLLDASPDDDLPEGSVVAYRCADCLDRWDLVLEEVEQPGHG